IRIETQDTLTFQGHILFGATNEVDAVLMLPFLPLHSVDASAIPYPNDFAAGRRATGFWGQARYWMGHWIRYTGSGDRHGIG
ncbi:MAG: hypothetical protein EA401_12225, partial [Planctomycetota bacterium]